MFTICTEASLCKLGSMNPNSVDKKSYSESFARTNLFAWNALKMSADIPSLSPNPFNNLMIGIIIIPFYERGDRYRDVKYKNCTWSHC